MSARTDLEHQISIETAECVENNKKDQFLNGFFSPRKIFEGGCEVQVRNKYAAQLAAIANDDNRLQQAQDNAFISKITGNGDSKFWMIILLTFVFIIIIITIL